MDYFISYDISGDRQRDKTARLLGEQGCKRVQKSVFLAPGFSAAEIRKLRQLLVRRIVPKLVAEDSILCIPVEKDQAGELVLHGKNEALAAALESMVVKIL